MNNRWPHEDSLGEWVKLNFSFFEWPFERLVFWIEFTQLILETCAFSNNRRWYIIAIYGLKLFLVCKLYNSERACKLSWMAVIKSSLTSDLQCKLETIWKNKVFVSLFNLTSSGEFNSTWFFFIKNWDLINLMEFSRLKLQV